MITNKLKAFRIFKFESDSNVKLVHKAEEKILWNPVDTHFTWISERGEEFGRSLCNKDVVSTLIVDSLSPSFSCVSQSTTKKNNWFNGGSQS